MTSTLHTPIEVNHSHKPDDNVDLLSILESALKTWKVWLISMIVVSIIFLGTQAALVLFKESSETIFSKPIRLTFPNAHRHIFPSGAKFTYSDIVAPAIAQLAFERNKLASLGFNIADLQGGLSATPYSPTYPLIVERYERMLSDKKLTPDNIAELKKQMEKELEQATSGEVLVSWRLQDRTLSKEIAEKVLNDITVLWAEKAIKEKGVLEISAALANEKSLNGELILNEELLVAGDILTEKLALLSNNIDQLSKFKGSQTITDPQTGMRLADLITAIDDLNKYDIRIFTAPIRLQGLTNTPELSIYYYQDKLNNLKIKLVSMQTQASALKESIASYSIDQLTSRSGNDKNTVPAIMPQLSSDILDKLVNLSSDLDREKYRQKLNLEWIVLSNEIAEIQSKIAETNMLLSAIEKFSQTNQINTVQKEYLATAKAKLPDTLKQLSQYFYVSERIAKLLWAETVGIKEQIYIPVTDTIIVKKESFDIKEKIISWIAILFLTSIFIVPGCMIRNALKAK